MASVIPSAPLGTDAATASVGLGATPATAPSTAAAERRFRFELAAQPGSPAQARRLTRARLTGWSVCEDTCDTAALVVSELVTNAIVHTASSHVVCELHDGDDLLRIAVRDEGCAPGRGRTPGSSRRRSTAGDCFSSTPCATRGAPSNTAPACWSGRSSPQRLPGRPGRTRDDLGWGARPKPGPAGGSEDGENDTGDGDAAHPARQRLGIPADRDGGRA